MTNIHKTRHQVLADGSAVTMNMITLSPVAALVWAEDVAMIAHDDLRLPLVRTYTTATAEHPYWLRVRTPHVIILVAQLPTDWVTCRVIPTKELIAFDESLAGCVLSFTGSRQQYTRAYWYRMLYGIGQTSRFYSELL